MAPARGRNLQGMATTTALTRPQTDPKLALGYTLLTDREALVVQLHYADGWSLRRIARGIGCDEASVRRAHRSALSHLRACCVTSEGPFDASAAALALQHR